MLTLPSNRACRVQGIVNMGQPAKYYTKMTPASSDLVPEGVGPPPAPAVKCCGREGVAPPRSGGGGLALSPVGVLP